MEPRWPVVPGYDVLAAVGSGSSATVWRARRQADRLLVALKVVPVAGGDVHAAMQEATVLARVRHPHVLHLYDVLPLPGRDGRPTSLALAVQLASGGSLAQVLAARGFLTVGELVTVVAPVAQALTELHRCGVVHGDVAPGNVLLLSDGMPMLSDLGVCRIAGEPMAQLHGTDGTVAPEVLEGFEPTAESDVYAVGALAWWCLTGDPPGWVGTRPSLPELLPDLAEPLRDLVDRCLAPEPEDRPDAAEVAVAIFAAGRPEPIEPAPQSDPAEGLTARMRADHRAMEGSRGGAHASGDRVLVPDRRRVPVRRVVIATGAAAVLALLVLSGWWLGPRLWGWAAGSSTAVATATGASTDTSTGAPDRQPVGPDPTAPPDLTRATSAAGVTQPPATTLPPAPERARTVLQPLLTARALAWEATDPELLSQAHQKGSAAWHSDTRALRRAEELGTDYSGVQFQLVGATVQRSEPDHLVLRAAVHRPSYTVSAAGQDTVQEPASTEEVTLEVRRGQQGWRLVGWG